ncbi:carotenoid oxygenase family protein [Desulfocurvibacter africanus]|uniref:Beta-carotene 15,15'-monooxygenase n=1 Tax=Desulfocurvibacter africanus subsp. africanus str. Walvis Bay TaxID=690850 RepID=F3Z0I1_DESAF|nr:carotenoid oxygenase family protein [Desulfocurvibacter africanus]EGJ50991.1 Beta-carotene 15,15'-monooxygenase [Desulfocurvibacter africanus subsp. africanus str. Walvis Bay]
MNQSPYHLGFTTLDRETRVEDLPIQGILPSWLSGILMRTAPARFEVGNQSYNHWFDGLAMLHSFTFADGRVSYANRFLQSQSYLEAMKKGRISRGEFATNPSRTLFERVAAFFAPKLTDNCNVSINKLADKIVAFTETRLPVQFDPMTLETLDIYDYDDGLGDRLPGPISIAHPHFDFQRGCHYSYMLDFGQQSTYRIFSIEAKTRQQKVLTKIPVERPAYMHSFAMTEHYLVLTEFPLVVNPLRLRFSGKPFIRNYQWKPERGVRFHVVDKETGRVFKETRGDTCFAFHHVNAFEEDDTIVVDIVTYPDPTIIDHLYLRHLQSDEPVIATGKLTRFRINSRGRGEVSEQLLSEARLELPRINYRHRTGQPYRFVFGVGNAVSGGKANFMDNLVKIDLDVGAVRTWCEAGCYPGEPVFVAAPDAREEDDGLILSVVLNVQVGRSFLLVLDASNWEELTRAEVAHHIPFGFHGNFLPAASGAESFLGLHR